MTRSQSEIARETQKETDFFVFVFVVGLLRIVPEACLSVTRVCTEKAVFDTACEENKFGLKVMQTQRG